VFINEWMAANTSASGFADPADGTFDDWFELFNPATNRADLAGCFLTDDLALPFQYMVPAGYGVPPGGFLLVWADGETNQNRPEVSALHVSFKLEKAGESIGLFAPVGTLIDAVTFVQQVGNWSQGRAPDGAPDIHFFVTPSPLATNTLPPALPPRVTSIQLLSGGPIVITWQAAPGRLYRVEAKTNLDDTAWTPLADALPALAASVTFTDFPGVLPQRFYRVVLVD
jgi:hypothetical protein